MKREKVIQPDVALLFDYDQDTGALSWHHRPPIDFRVRAWNTRYAGKAITALDRHGYIQVKLGRRTLRAHRIIWFLMTGYWPNHDIDHENGVRNDNRWENLRSASRSQNSHNRHAPRRSIYPRGVTLHKASGLYRAYLNKDRKQYSFGYFQTVAEAEQAFRQNAPRFLGEFYKESSHA